MWKSRSKFAPFYTPFLSRPCGAKDLDAAHSSGGDCCHRRADVQQEKGFCFEWWSFLIGRDASRFTFQTFTWMRRNPHVGSIQPDLQERVQAQLLRMSYYEKKHFIWERRGGRLQKKQMHLEGSAIWVTLSVFVSQKLVRTHRSSPFDSGLP